MGHIGLQLSKPAFNHLAYLVQVQEHISPFKFSMSKGICFSCTNLDIASTVRVSYVHALLVELGYKLQHLTLTYHVFNKLTGNGSEILGYGILVTFERFLSGLAEYIEHEQSCLDGQTSTI